MLNPIELTNHLPGEEEEQEHLEVEVALGLIYQRMCLISADLV